MAAADGESLTAATESARRKKSKMTICGGLVFLCAFARMVIIVNTRADTLLQYLRWCLFLFKSNKLIHILRENMRRIVEILHVNLQRNRYLQIGGICMKHIRLSDYYYFEDRTKSIEVSDEIYQVFVDDKRRQTDYAQYTRSHKAIYSLDYGDNVERLAVVKPATPEQILLQREMTDAVWRAFSTLEQVQQRRIYANVVMGIKKVQIAILENVDESAVRKAIKRGIKRMRVVMEEI